MLFQHQDEGQGSEAGEAWRNSKSGKKNTIVEALEPLLRDHVYNNYARYVVGSGRINVKAMTAAVDKNDKSKNERDPTVRAAIERFLKARVDTRKASRNKYEHGRIEDKKRAALAFAFLHLYQAHTDVFEKECTPYELRVIRAFQEISSQSIEPDRQSMQDHMGEIADLHRFD